MNPLRFNKEDILSALLLIFIGILIGFAICIAIF